MTRGFKSTVQGASLTSSKIKISSKFSNGNSPRPTAKGLRVRCVVHGPHGTEKSAELLFSDGSKRKRIDVDGRILYATLKQSQARDVNLPAGMESYPVWIPTISGRDVHASGRHSDHVSWTDLGEGWQGRAEVLQPEAVRRVHPEGRECGECRIFDGPSGREMMTKVTHTFTNGPGLSSVEWEINAESETRGGPPLTPASVGWCWRTKSLVAKNSPACEKDFMEKTR